MANDKHWEKDFREFLDAGNAPVPRDLSERVIGAVHAHLHPSPWLVLIKLALVQASAGLSSLLLCPQFGLSLGEGAGLMHPIMRYGEPACMVACGIFFMSVSLLAASFILRPEEVRVLRQHPVLQLSAVAALSLGAFACAGATILLGLGLIWGVAAVAGGYASLELGWRLRMYTYGNSAL